MAPHLLFDISQLDFDRPMYDAAAIEAVNPHRGHMRLIDAVVYESPDHKHYAAYHDVRPDAFWVAGHIPGRPLFPGVLMIEAAAQVASFVCLRRLGPQQFMGFVGVEGVKFRGQVVPGDRFVVLSEEVEFRKRRSVSVAQGVVNGNLVFEAKIVGMPM